MIIMPKSDLEDAARPIDSPPSPELIEQTAELTKTVGTKEGAIGCLVLGIVYALLYLSGILLFWMMGSAAHRYTRSYDQLAQAETLTEVRDALVSTFGSVNLTPTDIRERLAPLYQTIDSVRTGVNAAQDAQQAIDSAASSVQNVQR